MASMSRRLAGRVGTFLRSAERRPALRSPERRPAGENPQSPTTDGRTGEEGFTLAEVIVSIALFTVISFSVMFALVNLVKFTGITQNRVAAANLARQEVEKLRGQNSTLSQLDLSASTVSLKGVTYTVTPVLSPAANAPCAPGAARNVTVNVTWNNSGSRSVRYDTVLSC